MPGLILVPIGLLVLLWLSDADANTKIGGTILFGGMAFIMLREPEGNNRSDKPRDPRDDYDGPQGY